MMLQKRTLRIGLLAGASYRSHAAPLFMELNLHRFHQIRLFQTAAVFAYKYAHALLPSRFVDYLTSGNLGV